MRDTSSTVAQEIELVRAYLAIVQLRLGSRLDFSIDAADHVLDTRLPPMMLLPLVDHAVVYGLEPPRPNAGIRVAVAVERGRLRLSVDDTGAGFVSDTGDAAMKSIRERLEALYGGAATLALGKHGRGGTQ